VGGVGGGRGSRLGLERSVAGGLSPPRSTFLEGRSRSLVMSHQKGVEGKKEDKRRTLESR